VRVAGTNLDGSDKLRVGLTRVKGVGINFADALIKAVELDPESRVGDLTDREVARIEEALKDPLKYGVPHWMLNRRRDLQTGKDLHLIGSDLTLRVRYDIDFMKKIKTWKGWRHSLGLKVRGQRTKTTGRKGRVVGVRKKRLAAAELGREKAGKGR